MTGRERIREALSFKETGRVPIDIGGTKCTGVHMDLYCEICRLYGIDGRPPKVYDQMMMLAHMDEEMIRFFKSDCIQLENPVEMWGLQNKDWKIWKSPKGNDVLMPGEFTPRVDGRGFTWIDEIGTGKPLAFMPPDGLYFDRNCETQMTDDIEFCDLHAFKTSLPIYTDEQLDNLAKRAKFLYENTPYCVIGAFNRGQFGSMGKYAGHTISDWMIVLMNEPGYASDIIGTHAQNTIENARLYLEAVGDYIDVALISTFDYGTQRGEMFDPRLYRDIYLPHCKLVNDYFHDHSNVKTMYHSCGSNFKILEYFIQAGLDIFNPVQMNASNMEAEQIKEKYGNQIVFWGGGVDTQTVLQDGTPDEVREQVINRLKVMTKGGGYVFNPSHNLQYGIPIQNLNAMMDAVHTFETRKGAR